MPNTSSFSDFLSSIAVRGRSIIGIATQKRTKSSSAELVDLCHQLLSSKGEASGIALSNEILTGYSRLTEDEKAKFFRALYEEFSADAEKIKLAAKQYLENPTVKNMGRVSDVSEPIRRQLIIRLNLAPNATQLLIDMRADLLDLIAENADLTEVDKDFTKLFSSWFNGGFLQLNKMNWASPAALLEKVIRYEAVHGMSGWDDLKERIDPPDRLIYGFFHPRLNGEPLIFIEIALMKGTPKVIGSILNADRIHIIPGEADTAVFYSISNCQKGLKGVPLGSFLIKQVVEDLKMSFPNLKEFVTLSPILGFAKWLKNLDADSAEFKKLELTPDAAMQLSVIKQLDWVKDSTKAVELEPFLVSAVAWYLSSEKNNKAQPADPVAKFHLGNGARLERVNWPSDFSDHGINNSFGAMVNYRYRIDEIEQNHEKFVENGQINLSPETVKQVKAFSRFATLAPAKNPELVS